MATNEDPTNLELIPHREEQLRQLSVTVKSSTQTAVRAAIVAGRCLEEKEILLNGKGNVGPTGSIVLLIKCGEVTFGGHGEVYKRFKETGLLTAFPGEGTKVASSSDENFNEATLKVMEFHETYKGKCNDVDHNKFFRPGTDPVLKAVRGPRGKYKPRAPKKPKIVYSKMQMPSQSATVSAPVEVPEYEANLKEAAKKNTKKKVRATENDQNVPAFKEATDSQPKPLPLKKRKIKETTQLAEIPQNLMIDSKRKRSSSAKEDILCKPKEIVKQNAFAVQEDAPMLDQVCDEGYCGSQENNKNNGYLVSIESPEEDDIFASYFSQSPNLNDCSFHFICAQGAQYSEDSGELPFENL